MPEVSAIAVIVSFAHASQLKSAGDVVLGDPDLIAAVGEVGRIDQFQLIGKVLANGQAGGGVGFVRDQNWLD